MLTELYRFSQQFELSPIGYAESKVIYKIVLDGNQATFHLLQTAKTTTNKKGEDKVTYTVGERLLLPDLARNSHNPILIADTGDYVFGIGNNGKKRHQMYMDLLHQCYQATSEPYVKQVIDYLTQVNQGEILEQLEQLGYTPQKGLLGERDKFVFAYHDLEIGKDQFITNIPTVQQFWTRYYSSKQETVEGECLLTGKTKPVLINTFPGKVKGVPNTQTTGAAISSFDKSAYQSWGWSGNDNAPIGFDTATGILKGIELLISQDRHHYRLGNQMFVFWGNQNQEGLNPELWRDPQAARLEGIIKGIYSRPKEDSRPYSSEFYLGVLKGNSGRVAINGLNQITPEKLSANVKRFCQLQKLLDPKIKPIWVFRNAAFLDPNKEYTHRIDKALIEFVLLGQELPGEYAQKVINRICAEQDTFKSQDRSKALLFYLNKDNLNMDDPQDLIAYQLGRIAFLMHMAQMKGRDQEKEDTNVTRSLKTLSSTPSQVFGRLYQGCYVHHLQANDKMGYLKKLLDDEFRQLTPENLPDNFNLRQQSLFFVGFGKMRSEFFTKKYETTPENQEKK